MAVQSLKMLPDADIVFGLTNVEQREFISRSGKLSTTWPGRQKNGQEKDVFTPIRRKLVLEFTWFKYIFRQ